jgi:hypothetical protein
MRRHWMAIPIAVVTPFMVATFVLWHTEHWTNGAAGVIFCVLIGIAVVVGTLMVPLDPETREPILRPDRGRSRREDASPR